MKKIIVFLSLSYPRQQSSALYPSTKYSLIHTYLQCELFLNSPSCSLTNVIRFNRRQIRQAKHRSRLENLPKQNHLEIQLPFSTQPILCDGDADKTRQSEQLHLDTFLINSSESSIVVEATFSGALDKDKYRSINIL